MITRIFSRSALHEHADPTERVQGIAALPADSGEIAQLMTSDPAPEVRLAAAQRCSAYEALAGALAAETEPAVRTALTASLGTALAATPDDAGAAACLAAESCPDAARIDVARKAESGERRRAALAHVRDEALLVDLALTADIAETRQEAAERVHSPEALRKLSHAAKNKDRGVARLARQRIEAMTERAGQAESADAMLTELEALAGKPGPIVSAMVDLDRRWQGLAVTGDDARLARWAEARAAVQARFDREQDEQRGRAQFERRLREWLDALPSRRDDAIDALRTPKRPRCGRPRYVSITPRPLRCWRTPSAASEPGSANARRRPGPKRWWSKRNSSRPERRSTTRICRPAGRRSIEACAAPH